MRRVLAALLALPGTSIFLPAQAPVRVDVKEWQVPFERSRPRDPSVAPDGKIFFVGQVGNYVASLDPVSGAFRQYELDEGTLPHNQIVDVKGMIWYSGNANGMIGRLDPKSGAITRYPMPNPEVRDPHTLVFGHDGNIWFTAQQASYVGRLNVTTGKIDLIKVTGMNGRSALPYGIWVDPRGRPWFCEFGANKMAMIDAATMTIKEYVLPDARARPRRMAITSDGMIWYDDYVRGFLARLDPATGKVDEWQSPGGAGSAPYGMTVDDHDRIWYVETGRRPGVPEPQSNRLVAFDPATKKFFVDQNIGEPGPNTIRYMVFDKATREIWYGADQNAIGRIKVPPGKILVP